MLSFFQSFFKRHRTFFVYIVIGFTGFFMDIAVFVFLLRVLHVNQYIANPISTSIGIINNFLLNAHFNFKRTDRIFVRFLSFYAVGWVGIALGEGILWLFTDLWGSTIHNFLATFSRDLPNYQIELVKVGSLFIIAVVQYALNKKISFREGIHPQASKTE